jgi:hypothetical protein
MQLNPSAAHAATNSPQAIEQEGRGDREDGFPSFPIFLFKKQDS